MGQAQHGYDLFSVIHKADNLLMGDCGLEHLEAEGTWEAELGYDPRSDYWNQGLATEAAAAVRDRAFGVLRLPRLISLIRTGNEASRQVAEKIGMRHAADTTRHGQTYWLYALSRDDAGEWPGRS